VRTDTLRHRNRNRGGIVRTDTPHDTGIETEEGQLINGIYKESVKYIQVSTVFMFSVLRSFYSVIYVNIKMRK
jgi:hypothetical protein